MSPAPRVVLCLRVLLWVRVDFAKLSLSLPRQLLPRVISFGSNWKPWPLSQYRSGNDSVKRKVCIPGIQVHHIISQIISESVSQSLPFRFRSWMAVSVAVRTIAVLIQRAAMVHVLANLISLSLLLHLYTAGAATLPCLPLQYGGAVQVCASLSDSEPILLQ